MTVKLEKVDDKTAYKNLLVKYAELENKIADIKANCDLAIEGRDIKIKELELELTVEKDQHQEEINLHLHAEEYIESLEKEIKELKHNKKTVVHLADCLEEKMKERIEELETRCTELFLQNNEFAERFEKSIEIIKGLLSCCRNYPQENVEKMKQAVQFLNDIKEIEK